LFSFGENLPKGHKSTKGKSRVRGGGLFPPMHSLAPSISEYILRYIASSMLEIAYLLHKFFWLCLPLKKEQLLAFVNGRTRLTHLAQVRRGSEVWAIVFDEQAANPISK